MSFSSEQAQSHITPISYISPHRTDCHRVDEHLGAVTEWPMVPALLIIDSFAPHLRYQVLVKAATHRSEIWILKQHTGNPDEPVLAKIREIASLQAELPTTN